MNWSVWSKQSGDELTNHAQNGPRSGGKTVPSTAWDYPPREIQADGPTGSWILRLDLLPATQGDAH